MGQTQLAADTLSARLSAQSKTGPAESTTSLADDQASASPNDTEVDAIEADTTEDERGPVATMIAAVLEWTAIAAGSLFLALLLRTLLVQSYYIPSASMEHTLTINDRVLVNKMSYQFGDPGRGDVVVFDRPANLSGTMENLIKRVIAVGGDTVEGRNGHVLVNGVEIDEPYLDQGILTSTFGPIEIPDGELWVMGDNRSNSADSRVFGPITEELVVGRSFIQVWPIRGMELL